MRGNYFSLWIVHCSFGEGMFARRAIGGRVGGMENGSRWKAIACDLDGTLIGRDHKVLERDLEALRRARAAGVHVALCTGRNTLESAGVIGALGLSGAGDFCEWGDGQ